jgi:hypothetical protein
MRVLIPVLSLTVAVVALADEARVVPAALAVPSGEHQLLKAKAKGVQIYTCAANPKNATLLEWILKAPEAQLIDDKGKPLGKHYAGPTWEATDGSKVVGEVVAKVAQPGTIPWLLLRGKATGSGLLGAVTSVLRLDTDGGAAPANGCDEAHRGAEQRVPYSASYVFFGK